MPNCYHNKRAYRRFMDKKKLNRKLDLIEHKGYYGPVFWAYGYPGKNNHDREEGYTRDNACYIRTSRDSDTQRYYKKISKRKVRRTKDMYFGKSNAYRRCFDYSYAVY